MRQPISYRTEQVKPLAEVTAADVPRGLSAEDVAADHPDNPANPDKGPGYRSVVLAYATGIVWQAMSDKELEQGIQELLQRAIEAGNRAMSWTCAMALGNGLGGAVPKPEYQAKCREDCRKILQDPMRKKRGW